MWYERTKDDSLEANIADLIKKRLKDEAESEIVATKIENNVRNDVTTTSEDVNVTKKTRTGWMASITKGTAKVHPSMS